MPELRPRGLPAHRRCDETKRDRTLAVQEETARKLHDSGALAGRRELSCGFETQNLFWGLIHTASVARRSSSREFKSEMFSG